MTKENETGQTKNINNTRQDKMDGTRGEDEKLKVYGEIWTPKENTDNTYLTLFHS